MAFVDPMVAMAAELAGEASTSADLVGMNVRMVSAMVSQLDHGIAAVDASTASSRCAIERACEFVGTSDTQLQRLVEVGGRIDAILGQITQMSAQSRMLALNAKIESARAGAAGRGFAIVADEVKNLANESARAAAAIAAHVDEVHAATAAAAAAMKAALGAVDDIRALIDTIGTAVAEQRGLAHSVTGIVDEAATAVDEIGRKVTRANEQLAQLERAPAPVEPTTYPHAEDMSCH